MTAARGKLIAAVAAAGLVVASAVVVVVVGGVDVPSFPPLADGPGWDVSGRLAYLEGDMDADERCLRVVAVDGTDDGRTLRCGQLYGPLSWTDEGAVTVEEASARRHDRLVVDAGTGEIRSLADSPPFFPEPRSEREDGTRVEISWQDRVTSVHWVDPGGAVTELLRHRSYGPYGFYSAEWSPDGRFVLVSDSVGRALIVDPDSGEARIALEGATEPTWGPPAD